ncbi:hypothetical protein SAMN05444377_12017 [Flavobacterium fontis]|uniref:Uncharacterized protein n=1 Tax=Flavobacterium fontis TaxID=1124188 RepID=A0A1M5EM30_9FLAO|nr:hypothetical protein SAMN05444377_12017 [Flavobacterium fontis]
MRILRTHFQVQFHCPIKGNRATISWVKKEVNRRGKDYFIPKIDEGKNVTLKTIASSFNPNSLNP